MQKEIHHHPSSRAPTHLEGQTSPTLLPRSTFLLVPGGVTMLFHRFLKPIQTDTECVLHAFHLATRPCSSAMRWKQSGARRRPSGTTLPSTTLSGISRISWGQEPSRIWLALSHLVLHNKVISVELRLVTESLQYLQEEYLHGMEARTFL